MSAPRVGIVGARRERQGLGPYVVRDLAAAGACVPCFLATSEESRVLGERELREWWGVESRGHLDLERMLEIEDLDALAVLSPAETHERYVEAALAAGLHVLCEKPFVWERDDLSRATRRLADAFDARGLLLWENCQWSYMLPAYEALFPGALAAPPQSFDMKLQPASGGRQALGDALPHALSLLQVLVPGESAELQGIAFERPGDDDGHQVVRFDYVADGARAEARIELAVSRARRRAPELALDGHRARRVVSDRGYDMRFEADGRSVALADPLTLLVADFTAALARGGETRSREIAQRMELLEALVRAHARAGGEAS